SNISPYEGIWHLLYECFVSLTERIRSVIVECISISGFIHTLCTISVHIRNFNNQQHLRHDRWSINHSR
uniref:Ovule protein n=1 Tax=Parascaris univalens TaxID=6257 RepID=A0A915BN49_PARUN